MFSKTDFLIQFDHLRTELARLRDGARELNRNEAPDLNVFRLLGVDRREVKTHSAFLAALLDPGNVHGQGKLFLEGFLEYCKKKFLDFPKVQISETQFSEWESTPELQVDQGRIDIVVRRRRLGFLMAIENKIDAQDQPDQLKRYGEWIRGQEASHAVLLFLTKDGRKPTISEALPLSHQKDIADWLDLALKHVPAKRVRDLISQYIDVVRGLSTPQRYIMDNSEYTQRVAEVLSRAENLETAIQIRDIIDNVVEPNLVQRFWSELQREISERTTDLNDWEVGTPADRQVVVEPRGKAGRYLRFSVMQDGSCGLFYGVVWSQETAATFNEQVSKRLQEALPDCNGWTTRSPWWLRRQYVSTMSMRDSKSLLLIQSGTLREEVAKDFVELVRLASDAVKDANALVDSME